MKFRQMVALMLVAAMGWGGAAAGAEESVKVGVLAPLTGFAAADGLSVKNAPELAAGQVNAKGGVLGKKLEIVFEDTAGAEKAASGFERLVTRDKVVMVLGESVSSSALAAIEVAERVKVPFTVSEA